MKKKIILRKRQFLTIKKKQKKLDTIQRITIISFIVIAVIFVFTIIYALSYLQQASINLPSPDQPFGEKSTATEIYDRNGNLLYRVFDNEDRDPVHLDEIPPLLIWSYLAAEDLNFYQHNGIDFEAILRCGFNYIKQRAIVCGGSTITQQLIRKTTLNDDITLNRKIKEILLSMKIEQLRSKEEILEMYLTIVPSGSNIYGVTRASNFYFGKKPNELSLNEMVTLASIPQNPSVLSPTKSLYPEMANKLLEQRKKYVFDQLESNIDFINENLRTIYGDSAIQLNKETISTAREEVITFKDPLFPIKAPHFIFYTLEQLQTQKYINDSSFTLENIETHGFRIYTTLDLEIQEIAEQQVKTAVNTFGKEFGAENAGIVVMDPKTGEVLAMVGSYDYFGKESPSNCEIGLNCKFEPQVNVIDSLQAYGSTLKPMIYYKAFMEGLVTPETHLKDEPIRIGNYVPKNYDNKFVGTQTSRYMLTQSRNIPAINLLNQIGVLPFIDMLNEWGYSTINNPAGYGLSLAVGGGEIKIIEHAQAYGVLANKGQLTSTEVIKEITNYEGKVIYESKPNTKQVADERGVYLVNNVLNGNNGGPGAILDGRDMAGKTGTSESQTETLYIAYSPDIVVAGILLNNDNSPMIYGATGLTSVKPWVREFLEKILDRFGSSSFELPTGVELRNNGDLTIKGISKEYYSKVPSNYYHSY